MARTAQTTKTRVFISFDYDHDNDLKVLLLGHAKKHDSPFYFEDWSIKRETKGWKEDARKRIQRCNAVIVICGLHTNTAVGVTAEIKIAREVGVPYHLLKGRKRGTCRRPEGTSWLFDSVQDWSWENIENMCTAKPRSRWSLLW
jgi:hypothetical protein